MKRLIKTISVLITTATLISGCSSNRNSEYFVSVAPGGDIYGVQNGTSTLIETGPEIEFTIPEATAFNDFYNPLDTSYTEDTNTTVNPESGYPKNFGGIENCTAFSDGMVFIKNNSGKKYLIDKNGNIVFEFNDSWDNTDFLPEKISNGSFVYANHRYSDSDGNKMYYLMDDKGYIIRSSKKDGYTGFVLFSNEYNGIHKELYKVDGYIVAYKITKKYDGYKYELGVMDDAGNWVVPLSSDLAFFSLSDVDYTRIFDNGTNTGPQFYYMGDNTFAFRTDGNYCCYNFIEDKIIATDLPSKPIGIGENAIILDSLLSDDAVFDRKTGEITEFDEKIIATFDNVFLTEEKKRDEDGRSYYTYTLRNFNNEILIDFGSKYKFAGSSYTYECIYQDGYFIAPIEDSEGETYLLCTDSQGNHLFEPVHVTPVTHRTNICRPIAFYNDIIYLVCKNGVRQYNLEGELLNIIKVKDNNYLKSRDYNAVIPESEIIVLFRSIYDGFIFMDFDGNIIAE